MDTLRYTYKKITTMSSSDKITMFPSVTDIDNPHYTTLDEALSRIREGKSKEKVSLVRVAIRMSKIFTYSIILWSI